MTARTSPGAKRWRGWGSFTFDGKLKTDNASRPYLFDDQCDAEDFGDTARPVTVTWTSPKPTPSRKRKGKR